jgi:arsenate reductase (glutaredoxin)
MKVYGIKNCDTVKKSLKWLDDNDVKYEFHDYKKSGISKEKLEEWTSKVGYEALINKKGTTWKKLEPEQQNAITSKEAAFDLMSEKTSLIKRPLVEDPSTGKIILGFNPEAFSLLSK